MDRSRIIPFVGVSLILVSSFGCRSLQLNQQAAIQPVQAPVTSNYVDFELPDSLAEIWSYNAEAGFGQVEPILLGQYVLVANRRGEVHAVSTEDGRKIGAKKFGTAINGSPAIDDGLLYVPIDFGGKKGLKAWNLALGSRVFDVRTPAIESDVLIHNGRILFVDTDSVVRSLDAESGDPVWAVELDASVPVHVSPIIRDNRLFVVDGAGHGTVLAVDSGREVASFAIGGSVYNEIAMGTDRFYVSTVEGRLYSVRFVDLRTELVFESDNQYSQLTTASVSPGAVVVGGSDGIVTAIQPDTGRLLWTTDADYPMAAPPFVAGSRVYLGTLGRTLMVLSASTGEVIQTYPLRGRVKSPLAARDGNLFVLSEPRFVYRFGQSEH